MITRTFFTLLLCLVLPAQLMLAQSIKPKKDPLSLTNSSKEILLSFEKGDFSTPSAKFDNRLKEGLTPARLEASWKDLNSQLGPYKGVRETRSEMFVSSSIIYCVCIFGEWPVDFKTVYNGAGLLTGLYFLPHEETSKPVPDSLSK